MKTVRSLSLWYLLAIPVIAGVSTLDVQIGGLNVSGFLWALLLPVGVYLFVMAQLTCPHPRSVLAFWPWLVWCGFLGASLFWCDPLTRRNVQEALQFSMPVLVGLLAASAMRTDGDVERLFFAFGITAGLLVLFAACYSLQIVDRGLMEAHLRAAALSATLCGCLFLGMFPRRVVVSLAGWFLCLVVAASTSSRMATLALVVVPVLHPCFRGRVFWKLIAGCLFAVVGLAVFYTPAFQEHFFESGKGTIADLFSGNFKDLGRFEAWSLMWDQAWKIPGLGHGMGSAFAFVPTIWEDMHQIHNDYLRIFYELGVIGLVLFVAVAVWQVVSLRRLSLSATNETARIAFTGAYLGFIAMLISSATDNTLLYNTFYTNPLFALVGAAHGNAWWARCERLCTSPLSAARQGRRVPARWTRHNRAALGAVVPSIRRHNESK
jgi:O-antigen ligase